MENFDFSGWATKSNLKCSDGRVIMKDAFKHNDGQTVPLVWNHRHDDPNEILGHALLENRDEGVYAYCTFNDTESGKTGKLLVQHGDIVSLSIYANQIKQNMSNVVHGNIREVSLVLAGANPGASIESVIKHGEECEEEADIFTGENITIFHSDEDNESEEKSDMNENNESLEHSDKETIGDVFNTLTEKQKKAVYAMIGYIVDSDKDEDENKEKDDGDEMNHSEGGNEMKHNVFDTDGMQDEKVLTHSDLDQIVELSKTPSIGIFKQARKIYENENELQHDAFDAETMDMLLPEYKYIGPKERKIL